MSKLLSMVVVAVVMMAVTLLMTNCGTPGATHDEVAEVGGTVVGHQIYGFGNGVYYFDVDPWKDKDYHPLAIGSRLSQFIAEHPELELVTMNGQDPALGFWVVFREKEADEISAIGSIDSPAEEFAYRDWDFVPDPTWKLPGLPGLSLDGFDFNKPMRPVEVWRIECYEDGEVHKISRLRDVESRDEAIEMVESIPVHQSVKHVLWEDGEITMMTERGSSTLIDMDELLGPSIDVEGVETQVSYNNKAARTGIGGAAIFIQAHSLY